MATMMAMSSGGTREEEANALKIRDVQQIKDDIGRENIQFKVRGKTGARTVVPRSLDHGSFEKTTVMLEKDVPGVNGVVA
jgi:hypothetical protein